MADAPAAGEPAGTSPAEADLAAKAPETVSWTAETAPSGFDERPELYVAGAFAGGLALALVLRSLGGDDD